MNPDRPFGLDAWVRRIGELQLPAVTATAARLEDVARRDTSTLGQIGQAVLHDTALTSQVLRVANSAIYNPGRRDISTVSRAAIVLGFQTIRSICITSRLLSSLLATGELEAPIHQRLLRLLAQSLHAAVQARSFVAGADEETVEQVFITALLSELGACGFWSLGGPEAARLDAALRESEEAAVAVERRELGASFDELGVGLARNWKLGGMLVQALQDDPAAGPSVAAVRLARRFATESARTGWDSPESAFCIDEIAAFLGLDRDATRRRLLNHARETRQLAACYGADILNDFLPVEAVPQGPVEPPPPPAPVPREPDESLQLRVLRELTAMMAEQADFNQVIHTAMEGIHRGLAMDRTVTALIDARQEAVVGRFFLGDGSDTWSGAFRFSVDSGGGLLQRVLASNAPAWFDARHAPASGPEVGEALYGFCHGSGCLLAPVRVAQRTVALLYADRATSARRLDDEDFASFCHFAQQVTLCLSMIGRQRQ